MANSLSNRSCPEVTNPVESAQVRFGMTVTPHIFFEENSIHENIERRKTAAT
jgi:hypothetical protein